MSVFNPPPGWPLPRDWAPEPNWEPDPDWPAPPPEWNFWVPKKLKMYPIDLSTEIELGSARTLHLSKLAELTNRSADTIAWRLCNLAAKSNTIPLTTYLSMQDKVDSALLEARDRIFETLMQEAAVWTENLTKGSAEWKAATDTLDRISESRERFLTRSQQRVRAVLEASGSAVTTAHRPKGSPKTSQDQRAHSTANYVLKVRQSAGFVLIALLIVLVVGGWLVSQAS